jgi:hypothetical protein
MQPRDGTRRLGVGDRDLLELGFRRRLPFEQRVGEQLLKVGHQPAVEARGERPDVQIQDLREQDEESRGQSATVVLDEVQIGGGNPEALGECGLRKARPRAKRTDFSSWNSERRHVGSLQDLLID